MYESVCHIGNDCVAQCGAGNKAKNNINNQTLLQALSQYKIYGYNVKNFQIMIDKGLHRFQKKMNNIEKHFKNIVKKANEDKIRLGKINNGSLIRLW